MKTTNEKLQLLSTIFQGIIALGVVVVAFRELGVSGGNLEFLLSVLSVSLQVSAAVLLLIGTCGKNTDYMANEVLKKLAFLNVNQKAVCVSRSAFLYLAAGYLLSVFAGDRGRNPWIMLAGVLTVTVILVAVTCFFAKMQAGKEEAGEVKEDI